MWMSEMVPLHWKAIFPSTITWNIHLGLCGACFDVAEVVVVVVEEISTVDANTVLISLLSRGHGKFMCINF